MDKLHELRKLSPALFNLLRGYAALSPTRFLVFPFDLAFDIVHDFLLTDLLLNPLFMTYPPSQQYQATFWKWALNSLENYIGDSEEHEIDAQLYEHYVSLIPACSSSPQAVGVQPPAPSYTTYIWNADNVYRSATLLESRTTIESGTTGLKTWSASLVLAQFLIANPDLVLGRRVLELGSGAGLLGIIVATLQLSGDNSGGRVHLTDTNPEVLARCAKNVNLPCNLSSNHQSVTSGPLDWTDTLDSHRLPVVQSFLCEFSPEFVLGADVVYDPSIIAPLVQTIRQALLCNPISTALIALTVRNENTIAQFIQEAENYVTIDELSLGNLPDSHDFWGMAEQTTNHNIAQQSVKLLRFRNNRT